MLVNSEPVISASVPVESRLVCEGVSVIDNCAETDWVLIKNPMLNTIIAQHRSKAVSGIVFE